jgi:chemotaxis protein MotB
MKPQAPVVIIKKRRAHHGGHHGGAWKVAYADFVTAMMAFFLVMWLKAPGIATLRDQIEFTFTSEGLRIELIEGAGSSFFDSGSALLRGESVRILEIIAGELGKLANDLAIEGHTDRRAYASGNRYGNWELSSDRANAARREMEFNGLKPGQVQTVRGFADTQLHLKDEPLDPRNRRVSIVVRSQEAVALESALQK